MNILKKLRPNKCISLSQFYDKDLMKLIKKSDVIYLSSYWKNLSTKYIELSVKNIENITNAELYVVGTKNFKRINIRDILSIEDSKKYKLDFKLSDQKIKINVKLKNKLGFKYIDLFNLFCKNYENCLTFIDKK